MGLHRPTCDAPCHKAVSAWACALSCPLHHSCPLVEGTPGRLSEAQTPAAAPLRWLSISPCAHSALLDTTAANAMTPCPLHITSTAKRRGQSGAGDGIH